ncbi:MAG: hypothetical protein U5L96_21460 [Owenweeksia sp.]|nr:hypothetical protein [Owenweeksia sp.]
MDNVGNEEAAKPSEQSTVITASDLRLLNPSDTSYCAGDSISIGWKPGGVNWVNLQYATAGDSVFHSIAEQLDSTQTPYHWKIPDSLSTGNYIFRVSDTTGLFNNKGDSVTIGAYPVVNLTADLSICAGDSIQLNASGGTIYNWSSWSSLSDTTIANPMAYPDSSTTYHVAVSNVAGCAVMDSVTVNVFYPDTTYSSSITCNPAAAGVQITSYTNGAGCDSIVIDSVVLRPSHSQTLAPLSICQGDSALIFGEYQNMAKTYYDSLNTQYGCDSVRSRELLVNPVYDEDTITYSICQGDSLSIFGNYHYNSGYYHDTLVTTTGCDSILNAQLIVHPEYNIGANRSICSGDSTLLAGMYQTSSGTYVDTFSTINGCDSIISTQLTVKNVPTSSLQANLCQGDSVMIGGQYRRQSGSYIDTLAAANGCDSIVTTNLLVSPTHQINNSTSICQGDSAYLAGAWRTSSGTYTANLTTAKGCDSVMQTTLSVISNSTSNQSLSICAGDSAMIAGAYRST